MGSLVNFDTALQRALHAAAEQASVIAVTLFGYSSAALAILSASSWTNIVAASAKFATMPRCRGRDGRNPFDGRVAAVYYGTRDSTMIPYEKNQRGARGTAEAWFRPDCGD
jgi:hypothetical protein